MRLFFIAMLVLLAILQYRLWFADNGLLTMVRLKQTIHTQKIKNAALRKNNALLLAEIKALKQDKNTIENLARYELGMIKKDEVFYQLVK